MAPSDPEVQRLFGYDPVSGQQAYLHFHNQGSDCLRTLIQQRTSVPVTPQGLTRLARLCADFPAEAIPRLLAVLKDGDLQAQEVAAGCFRFLDYAAHRGAAEKLARMGKAEGLATAYYSVEALGYLGAVDHLQDMVEIAERAPSQLDKALLHALPYLTRKVTDTAQARQVLEQIEGYVERSSEFTRIEERLPSSLDTVAFGRRAADPLLERWLVHPQPVYRLVALDALGNLRLERTSAKIAERLFDAAETDGVRARAAAVLGLTGGADAVSAIERALMPGAVPAQLRSAVLLGFARLYDRFPRTVDPALLDECLRLGSEPAASLLYSVGLRGDGEPYLQAALSSSDEYTRGVAALALGKLRRSGASARLDTSLRNATGELERMLVLAGLIHTGDTKRGAELHRLLVAQAGKLQDDRWKHEIVEALGLAGGGYAAPWAEALDIEYAPPPAAPPSTPASAPAPAVIQQPPPAVRKQPVITLHGIRTRGGWQKQIDTPLARHDFVPYTLDYGFFYALQLALGFARQSKVEWFHQKWEEVRKESGGVLPSVIAHSFGTYLVAQTVLKYEEVKFDRMILCGSIVRRDYPWTGILKRGGAQRVLNDYGGKDLWVKAAEWVVKDGGPSGAHGFEDDAGGRVVHRYRPEFRHSDYFYASNYEDTWIVFLEGQDPTESVTLPTRAPNWKHRVFVAAALLLLTLALFLGYRWLHTPAAAPDDRWAWIDPLNPPAYASSLDRTLTGAQNPLNALQADQLRGLRREESPVQWVVFGSPEYAPNSTPSAIEPAVPLSATLLLYAFESDGSSWRQIEKSELKHSVRCDRCPNAGGPVRLVVFVFPLDRTTANILSGSASDPKRALTVHEVPR
jgi:HEAT repeat protein